MNRTLALTLLAVLTACAPITPTVTVVPSTVTAVSPTVTSVPVTPSGDAQFLPNPSLTPGSLNPAVTQDTIQTTICVPGYSSSIRPPVSYTDALKAKELADPAYGDTANQNPADYELDHFIPLSSGGNPTDQRNLWPQPRNTAPYNAGVKDQLEYKLYQMICAGQITLADAQKAIVTDWVQAYRDYVSTNLGINPIYIAPEP